MPQRVAKTDQQGALRGCRKTLDIEPAFGLCRVPRCITQFVVLERVRLFHIAQQFCIGLADRLNRGPLTADDFGGKKAVPAVLDFTFTVAAV